MKKMIPMLLGAVLIVAALAGCAEAPAGHSLGQQFTLKPGQSAEISSEDLKLNFDKVLNDSRCPEGATCIWQGQVQCLLTVDVNGEKEQITLTQDGLTSESASQVYGKYRFKFNVTPYPKVDETIASGDYRLELSVTLR